MIILIFAFILGVTFAFLAGVNGFTLVVGFVLGFAILSLLPQLPGAGKFSLPSIKHLFQLAKNVAVFLYDLAMDLTMSNIQIAWDVWTWKDYYKPRLVDVPIEDLDDFQIFLLASRITLTPGTISVDVSDDRKVLVVHVMYPKGNDNDIAAGLKKPIQLLTRGLS